MKAEQLFEKFKVLNEDYNDKLNIAKNKADHSKEALNQERGKAIEAFNKSKKAFEEVFGKNGDGSKEFTNMNNLSNGTLEGWKEKKVLDAAFERVYEDLSNVIKLSRNKNITPQEYKKATERLFADIDKAYVIEMRVPAKIKYTPFMPEFRKNLQGLGNPNHNTQIGSNLFPVGDKGYARTDLFPKVIKFGDIPGTDTGMLDVAKELAGENKFAVSKLFKRLKKAKTVGDAKGFDKGKIIRLDTFDNSDNDTIESKEDTAKSKAMVKLLIKLGNLIPSIKEKRNDITKDFEVADLKGSQDKEKLAKINEISKKKFQDYISGNEKNGKEESEEELEVSSKKLAKELENLDSSNIKSKNAQSHAQYQWQKENAKRAQNEALNKAAGFNSVDDVLDKAGIPSVMVKKLLGHSIKFYGNIPSPAGGTFDQLKGYLVLADANKLGGKDSKFVINIDGKDWYGYKIGKQYRSVKIAETEETRKMHEGEKDVLFIYKATNDEKAKIREVFDSKFKKSSIKTSHFNY